MSSKGERAERALQPILVDYFTRDGSTLMMRLLASSPQIVVGGDYPFEQKYFAYLYRWAHVIDKQRWPKARWNAPQNLSTLSRDKEMALIGPPPWLPRDLFDPDGAAEPLSDRLFTLAWEEFSQRAASVAAARSRDRSAHVRYYAEKHLNSWDLDLDRLPAAVRIIALLRDPRDTYVSIRSFSKRRQQGGSRPTMGRRPGESLEDWVHRHVRRQRERLQWLKRIQDDGSVPVVRYEDLVRDLPGQAARLEDWLEIDLDARAVAADQKLVAQHVTAESPEHSIGRWRDEMPVWVAKVFKDQLEGELAALGFDTDFPMVRRARAAAKTP